MYVCIQCEFEYVRMSMWVWVCENEYVSTSMWVWACEHISLSECTWMWVYEWDCRLVWLWEGKWKCVVFPLFNLMVQWAFNQTSTIHALPNVHFNQICMLRTRLLVKDDFSLISWPYYVCWNNWHSSGIPGGLGMNNKQICIVIVLICKHRAFHALRIRGSDVSFRLCENEKIYLT